MTTLTLKSVPAKIKSLQENNLKVQKSIDHLKKQHPNVVKAKRTNINQESLCWLVETYPKAFFPKYPKPLKLNIFIDIVKNGLPEGMSKNSLKSILFKYCSSSAYLKSVVINTHRLDLNGIPCELILDSHKEFSVLSQQAKLKKATKFRKK